VFQARQKARNGKNILLAGGLSSIWHIARRNYRQENKQPSEMAKTMASNA
jgi:hypothetical protein